MSIPLLITTHGFLYPSVIPIQICFHYIVRHLSRHHFNILNLQVQQLASSLFCPTSVDWSARHLHAVGSIACHKGLNIRQTSGVTQSVVRLGLTPSTIFVKVLLFARWLMNTSAHRIANCQYRKSLISKSCNRKKKTSGSNRAKWLCKSILLDNWLGL